MISFTDGKWNNKNRLCPECHKCFQNGSYCSICMKAYDENCSDGFVGCDECEKWIHAQCDGISEEELESFEKNDIKYACPNCRAKKQ